MIAGFVDAPPAGAEVDPGLVRVWGWAHCGPDPPARVEVLVGHEPAGLARAYQLRPDVAEALGDRALLWSGFEHYVDLRDAAAGLHEIAVVVHSLDGSTARLPPVPVQVRERSVSTEHSARQPVVRVQARRSPGAVAVLVVAHSLDRAGAELCLLDVVRRLAGRGDLRFVLVSPRDGPLRAEFERLGIPVRIVGHYPTASLSLYELKVAAIEAIGAQQRCDVVLANTLAAFCAADVADRLGLPLVWAIHEGWSPELFWASFFGPGELSAAVRERGAAALRGAGSILFVADATRRLYEPAAAPAPCLTVPYGVDFDRAEELRHDAARDDARRALGIEADEELLLTIGPIVPAKCQSQLVGAFARIAGRWPKATLVLLGDGPGPYASALRDRVALSELRDRVRFEPVAADLAAWYLAADWLVVPSDIESMPRTVVEALAFVLPVAATSVGGVPDLIEDGASGLLCRARDTSAMIAMLERALSMSIDDRRRLAAAGAARARPYHDPQACADAYADCLLGAVRAGRAA